MIWFGFVNNKENLLQCKGKWALKMNNYSLLQNKDMQVVFPQWMEKKKKNSIVLLKGHQKRQFFSYYQISQIKYYMHRWKIAFIKINEKMFKSAFLHCSTDRNAVNKFPSTQRPLLVGQQKTP